jgi:hypothetical protein
MLPENSYRITNVLGNEFNDLYYNPTLNNFYTKSRASETFREIKWKHVYQEYVNKKGIVQRYLHRYINLNNFKTQSKLRLNEERWKSIWDDTHEEYQLK